jgi:hypothetical protein
MVSMMAVVMVIVPRRLGDGALWAEGRERLEIL